MQGTNYDVNAKSKRKKRENSEYKMDDNEKNCVKVWNTNENARSIVLRKPRGIFCKKNE